MATEASLKKQDNVPTTSSSSISIPLHDPKQKYELDGEDTVCNEKPDATSSSDADVDVDPAAPPPMFYKPPPRQFFLIMTALALGVFLASLDQIIVSTSIPAITKEYNSLNDISWLGTAYMMTSTALQPLYGKVSDIFGRKAVMLFANFMFLIGSAISGWAKSMAMLIVGRAVAGIGAGGLMAMVFIILSDMLDMRERGKYMGGLGAIFSLSSVIGPLMGGAFTDHVTWRWSFWINLPLGAISVVFIWFNLDLPTPKGSFSDKVKRIDFYGSILLLITVTMILLALSWGGSKYPWNSGTIIGLLCAGIVSAIIFILVEWKIPAEPIIPVHLFKVRNIWATYGSLFFGGGAFFGILFYIPIYFQVIKQESATVGGLETVPFVFGIVITSISSGIWILKKGTYVLFPAMGNLLVITGSSLCLLFVEGTPRVATIFILLICGLGIGLTLQPSTLAVQAACKPKYMATVTAMVQFMRSLGSVFGIAIVGSVFNNKLESSLHERFPGDESILRVTQDYGYIMNYGELERSTIYATFVRALHFAFYCCVAFSSLALVSSFFIQHKELKTNANQAGKKVEMAVEMV